MIFYVNTTRIQAKEIIIFVSESFLDSMIGLACVLCEWAIVQVKAWCRRKASPVPSELTARENHAPVIGMFLIIAGGYLVGMVTLHMTLM